jgi:hypothetical protein
MTEKRAADTADRTQRTGWRRANIMIPLLLALAIGLTYAGFQWRKHAIDGPVQAALSGETAAVTKVYRRDFLGGNDIVFNIQSVEGETSMADISRHLLKTAEALKDQQFGRVYLAYRGREKFYFEGPYFQAIGVTRSTQNPVYTIRTMPENVHNLDGSPAFQSWSGGLLGVLGQQLEDNNNFHRKWWVDDALADLGS